MNIREGVDLALVISKAPKGYRLRVQIQVAGLEPRVLSTKTVATLEELWIAVARWAEDRLAKLGLERIG